MPWFKVDDGFYDHPKLENVSMAARGLWVTAGAWCARHVTDGVISAKRVRALGGTPAQISSLIRAGLWVQFESDLDGKCYSFHDWLDMQPSRNQVAIERASARERQRKSRANQTVKNSTTRVNGKMSRRDTIAPVTRDNAVAVTVASQRPDPTRPVPLKETPFGGKESSPRNPGVETPCAPDGAPLKTSSRGTRIKPDWQPSDTTLNLLADRYPWLDLHDQVDRFRDHWLAETGQKATKRDWDAAFRNWVKKSADYQGNQPQFSQLENTVENWLPDYAKPPKPQVKTG